MNRGGVVKSALAGGSCSHHDNKSRSRYPPVLKSWVIRLHRDHNIPINHIAQNFDLSTKTVWEWIIASRGGQKLSMKGWTRRHPAWFYWGKGKLKQGSLYTQIKLKNSMKRLNAWLWYYTKSGRRNIERILWALDNEVDPP